MIFFKKRRLRIIAIAFVSLLGVSAISWLVWFRFVSTEQFRTAMERRDFRRAEKLWNWGVYAPANDPYIEFMRVLDRLRSITGVQVLHYTVRRTSPVYGTNRFTGSLDISEKGEGKTKELGVSLRWDGQKWLLIIDHEFLPPYVKKSLHGNHR